MDPPQLDPYIAKAALISAAFQGSWKTNNFELE